jgi:predicted dehydrogenase
MKRYKAAIVGLGNIAWKFDQNFRGSKNAPQTHAGAYKIHQNTVLVGGCSKEEQDRVSFAKNYDVPVFDSIDELLEQTTPDIASVCSPSDMHFEHVCRCMEAGVPMIWLEKPPAVKPADLEKLIERQKNSKSIILVNYQRRYCPYYSRLKELYNNRTFGKTIFIYATYSKGLSLNGSHIIDAFFFILGDEVQVSLECVMPSEDDENPSFSLRTADGLRIFVAGISLPYHCMDIGLTFENGRASILYGGMQSRLETKVEHELFRGFYRLKEQQADILGPAGIEGAMLEALNNLIISYQQQREPLSNLKTAYNTLAIIDKVEQAIKAAK